MCSDYQCKMNILLPDGNYVTFEVLTAVSMKSIVFFDVIPCNLVKFADVTGGTQSVRVQG
jgi:hypothetical protein